MVRKKQDRVTKRSKASNQSVAKILRRRRALAFTDSLKNKIVFTKELNWLLGDKNMFADDAFHGNINWDPTELVSQAIIWALQESKNVTDAFDYSLKFCDELGLKQTARSYPRLMNALTRYDVLSTRVRSSIQQRAKEISGDYWRADNWVPFAFDGSRVSLPRTVSNEKAYCAANYGQGKTAKYRKKKTKGMRRRKNEKAQPQPQRPQIWITMVWHMGLRLPWTWRSGPSNSSERAHVENILQTEQFPEEALFCGDAGFVGYSFWNELMLTRVEFLVRVGANVSLLSQYADIQRIKDNKVLCWPKGKMQSGEEPLQLRLVKITIGKTTMWMLTSVLDRRKLTHKQIVRYYKMRWGIEVEFRGLKQTMDNRKLSCRNSDNAKAEMEWSLLSLAVAELLALRRQIPQNRRQIKKREYEVTDRSLAEALRAIRRCMASPDAIPEPGEGLIEQLANAKVQRYKNKTDKNARYRPPNPDKKPLGDPKIRRPDAIERAKLKELDVQIAV